MYLGIYLKNNNKKKREKKRKKKRTKKRRKEQGSNPAPSARCELYLTDTRAKRPRMRKASIFNN